MYVCLAPVIVISGYHPAFTVRSLLTAITGDLLQHSGSFRDYYEQLRFIKHSMASSQSFLPEFYLVRPWLQKNAANVEDAQVIHSIDGPAMRSETVQVAPC